MSKLPHDTTDEAREQRIAQLLAELEALLRAWHARRASAKNFPKLPNFPAEAPA